MNNPDYDLIVLTRTFKDAVEFSPLVHEGRWVGSGGGHHETVYQWKLDIGHEGEYKLEKINGEKSDSHYHGKIVSKGDDHKCEIEVEGGKIPQGLKIVCPGWILVTHDGTLVFKIF